MSINTIHQFVVSDLQGRQFNFATLKGKKVMIVNTASECGQTPQYKQLQLIYDQYKDKNFVIVGFPANNFGEQEPGTNAEIATFCQQNYGVTFPMMAKISVKGNDMHPIYRFLTQKSQNGVLDSEVKWNFQKYLINENGELEKVIDYKTLPTDPVVVAWIERPLTNTFPCDSIPSLNKKIVEFVSANLNRKVGRGECWDLAATPLNTYKAKWDGRLTYGRLINNKSECIYPGDIIQFENVVIETVSDSGKLVERMPFHTAIVYKVHATSHYTIAHQNYGNVKKVILTTLKMDSIKQGKAMVYRPQEMVDSRQ